MSDLFYKRNFRELTGNHYKDPRGSNQALF